MSSFKWGQTPWDEMSREELLREVQRYHSAAVDARSTLRLVGVEQESSGFWGPQGTGGRAVMKLEHAMDTARKAGSSDELYRAFYRYADDLLFPPPIGKGWAVCELGHMTAGEPPRPLTCHVCRLEGREPQELRPINWDDLAPDRWRT